MEKEKLVFRRVFALLLMAVFLFAFSVPVMAGSAKCGLWNYFLNPNRFGKPKRKLKGNMMEIYNVLPEEATNPLEIFTKSVWYGRLRMNYFKWLWDEGRYYKKGRWRDRIDPTGFGFGGSIIYKTAPFYGVSATVGFYGTHDLSVLDEDDALFGKSGKDTFSRFDVMDKGDWGMAVVAQAYLEFKYRKTDLRIGRMIVECPFVKSNDTKMIPNTMRGVHLVTKEIPHTKFQFMYFDRQKLRDHTNFHDVLTFNWKNTDPNGVTKWHKWANQDDSAIHKGLSYENMEAYGMHTRNRLIIVGLTSKGFLKQLPQLKLDLWNALVPDMFDTFLGEANYTFKLPHGWKLMPGFRFMHQFDDEAGDIGGAALSGIFGIDKDRRNNTRARGLGYKDPDSVDATMYGFRLRLKKGAQMFHFGVTYVTDDADFIMPWRAWPTQGYTRSMAQYNWEAGTASYMLKWVMDWNKARLIKGFKTALDITYMDYDDEKERLGSISKTDRYIIHLDAWWTPPIKLPKDQWLQCKFRLGYVQAQHRRYAPANGENPSYTELRFEINYLF